MVQFWTSAKFWNYETYCLKRGLELDQSYLFAAYAASWCLFYLEKNVNTFKSIRKRARFTEIVVAVRYPHGHGGLTTVGSSRYPPLVPKCTQINRKLNTELNTLILPHTNFGPIQIKGIFIFKRFGARIDGYKKRRPSFNWETSSSSCTRRPRPRRAAARYLPIGDRD